MLVVSDFNGTLSHGSPIIGLVGWVGENQSKLRKNIYMAKIAPSWFLAKRGLIDWNQWVIDLFISCMPVLKDATPKLFEEVISYTMETQLWAKRRLDMIERISGHVQQGDQVYIVTGMWQPTVARFAAQIGVKGLGTEIKFENGWMSLTEPIAHGPDKADKIRKRLREAGIQHYRIPAKTKGILTFIRCLMRLRSIVTMQRINIIHSHHRWTSFICHFLSISLAFTL